MKNSSIYTDVEIALYRDYKINLFIRMKQKYNILINDIDYVDKFEYNNNIVFGQNNGSKIILNCDDIESVNIRR